ncbi:MAG: zinc-binding dehydrogenase [bacterium]
MSKLLNLLSEKKIKPIIAEKIPPVEAVHAHELLEKGAVKGKIALVCNT